MTIHTNTPKERTPGRARRIMKHTGIGLGAMLLLLVVTVGFFSRQTEADISALREDVAAIGEATPSLIYDASELDDLPEPVQRYFEYTFVGSPERYSYVELTQSGDFRRPLTDGFNLTTAEQTVAVGTPALMFSARTEMIPCLLWATAYDHYAEGEMEMKAKVLSTLTVVNESETPALNQTSLQRWLLESPMYPASLLPGGPVRWEAINDSQARAVLEADGLEASLVATFRADGSLESFMAEADGDLTTPYHGSGEHVARDDYREVGGMMIPHRFTISRAAGGELFPFWTGELDTIEFTTPTANDDR